MQGNEDLARLNQQFYSFNKDHVLGFGSFHEAIITDSQSLIKGNLQSLNKNNYFGVQLEDNLKIYIFTKVAKDQIYQKQLILTNPIGLQLLKNIRSKFSSNNAIVQNFDFKSGLNNCLEEKAQKHPDLLVQDIYGKDSSSIGLPEKLLASSMGKLTNIPEQHFETKEIIRSFVMALAINTAQISGLFSKRYKVGDILILKSQIESISFNRLIYVYFLIIKSLLNFYSPESNLYVLTPNYE